MKYLGLIALFLVAQSFAAPSLPYATGLKMPKDWKQNAMFVKLKASNQRMPKHFDWREELNWDWPVKDQGQCGSCWAFGSTAVLEAHAKMEKGEDVTLSEQHLVSCNPYKWGCEGGWIAHILQMDPGQTSLEEYPYEAKDSACKKDKPIKQTIQGFAYVAETDDKGPSVQDIKQAIYNHGVVAVSIKANFAFMMYSSGIFKSCDNEGDVNHLIDIVGWDDDGGYWIVRNSWGDSWGDKGYGKVKYGCSQIGSVTSYIPSKISCTPQPVSETGERTTDVKKGEKVDVGLPGFKGMANTKYHWSPEEGLDDAHAPSTKASPKETTTYTLTAETDCGTATSLVTVRVKE